MVRYDKKTGEALDIKPQEKGDEPAYRFNWDSPLIISNASNTRIYFAAQKVFRARLSDPTFAIADQVEELKQ